MLGGLFRRGSKSEASWEQASLEAHNKRRAAHGAPPLTWSDECYQEAKKQADDCQRRRALGHGHLTGPSGRHGQNAYWSSAPVSDVDDVVASWYKEVTDHGYNYANPTNTHQTGHFTQVVWHSTSQVGVAKSADGNFVVANYFPAGNLVGNYPKEVLPPRGGQPYPPPAKAAPQPTRRPTATTPTTAAAATATTTKTTTKGAGARAAATSHKSTPNNDEEGGPAAEKALAEGE